MQSVPTSQELSPFSTKAGDLVKPQIHQIAPQGSVSDAAARMVEAGVGSLLVLEHGRPVGIITRSDFLRTEVIRGDAATLRVSEIMSKELVTIQGDLPVFDCLMLMIRHGIGHVVVMRGSEVAGIVADRDWVSFQERHPRALLRDIDKAETVAALALLRETANAMIRRFFSGGGTAAAMTQLVTEINDRVTRRVIELTLSQFESEDKGTPPVKFAWVSMGSEGRQEQTLSTDQDNGIIFQDMDDGLAARTQPWFLDFAREVVGGLEQCGFPLCKGNVMASNPQLCRTLDGWKSMFSEFIQNPQSETLFQASIYFDFRCLYGERALVDSLRGVMQNLVAHNKSFIRQMAGVMIHFPTPLPTLEWKLRALLHLRPAPMDIKRFAIVPLVNAVRLLALANAIGETNTLRRASALDQLGVLEPGQRDNIETAYDYVMLMRLMQNFQQQDRGETPQNIIRFDAIPSLKLSMLKDVLRIIQDFQEQVFDGCGGLYLQ